MISMGSLTDRDENDDVQRNTTVGGDTSVTVVGVWAGDASGD